MEKYVAVENMIFAHKELKSLTERVNQLNQMLTKVSIDGIEVNKYSGITITSHHTKHIVISDEELTKFVIIEVIKKLNYRITELKLLLEKADKAIASNIWRADKCDLKTTKN